MEIIGAIFIIIFGCLGHFIFEWSGHRKWCGLLFATNESTWEHVKLTIYPSLVWGVVSGFVYGWTPLLLFSLTASMSAMIILVPALFYGYTAILGRNYLITDIICFILAVSGGMWVFHNAVTSGACIGAWGMAASAIVAVLIIVAYFTLTYHAPHNFLFKDPVTGGYGPLGHDCDADFHKTGRHHHHHNRENKNK